MSSDDHETVATVKLVRNKRTGKYVCDVDLGIHAEVETGFETIDVVFEHAKRVVQSELAARDPRSFVT